MAVESTQTYIDENAVLGSRTWCSSEILSAVVAMGKTLSQEFREICSRECPLREKLADFSNAVREFSLPFAEAYDELVTRLEAGKAGVGAPNIGDALPPFILPDCSGRLISLGELLDTGPMIISFNRGHWCEYCMIELTALSQALQEFSKHGARVVSIMPETNEFISKASNGNGNSVLILSDIDNSYALSLGLVVWLGEKVRTMYIEHGLHLEAFQRSDTWFVPIPATFVVDRNSSVVGRYVDPDFRRRMEIGEILVALKKASLVKR